jgi:hypothetical protein
MQFILFRGAQYKALPSYADLPIHEAAGVCEVVDYAGDKQSEEILVSEERA